MFSPLVSDHIFLPSKRLAAGFTSEGFLTSMHSLMLSECSRRAERISTLFANMGPRVSVYHSMLPQGRRIRETSTAKVTFELFHTWVSQFVMPKIILSFEQLPTFLASKWSNISVQIFMESQGGSAHKSFLTVTTFIWSLSRMCTSDMIGQGLKPSIFLITFVTVIGFLRNLWKVSMSVKNTFL